MVISGEPGALTGRIFLLPAWNFTLLHPYTFSLQHSFPVVERGPRTADQVSYIPRRYDQLPSDWQQVSWDEVQIRPSPFSEYYENRGHPSKKKTW